MYNMFVIATRIIFLKTLIALFIFRLTYGHIFVGTAVFRATIRKTRQMRSERKKKVHRLWVYRWFVIIIRCKNRIQDEGGDKQHVFAAGLGTRHHEASRTFLFLSSISFATSIKVTRLDYAWLLFFATCINE